MRAATPDLDAFTLRRVRVLLDDAFGERFDEHDFDHSLGGTHVLAYQGDLLVGHASVVPRTLYVGDRSWDCGYVEAVAVHPDHQRMGIGSALMVTIAGIVDEQYSVGALSTSRTAFYERLGWRPWAGPSFVVCGGDWVRTPDEDDGVMVRDVRGGLDFSDAVAVDERAGDSW